MPLFSFKIRIKQFVSSQRTLVLIFLLALPLAYLFFIVYFYAFNIEAGVAEPREKISINMARYNKAIENLRQRELNSSQELIKSYLDPFIR